MLGASPVIDHNGLFVTDYDRALGFYARLLAPFGYERLIEIDPELGAPDDDDPGRDPRYVLTGYLSGFGDPSLRRTATEKPPFWITQARAGSISPSRCTFVCPDAAMVDEFFAAGCAAGGRPGQAPGTTAGSYVASVLDPDGNEIEAVATVPTARA